MDAPVSRHWLLSGFSLASLMISLMMLSGCETLSYYAHVAGGQLQLLKSREKVDSIVAELEISGENDALRERLVLSQQMLEFAEQELELEVEGRYRSYVELDRSNVVWNLFAAPELSLEPYRWCYPFVGCAPYRGYFTRQRAHAHRDRLIAEGLETYVGGVSAYSTLGWFDDPLLSSFVTLSEPEFVELIFHELAHSRVWLPGDTTFNESFATFVGQEGMRQWLESTGNSAMLATHLAGRSAWRSARSMLLATKSRLKSVYGSSTSDVEKRSAKTRLLNGAVRCLEEFSRVTAVEGYLTLIPRLNNAYLASLAAYADGVPAFAALFDAAAGDWPRFYAQVEAMAELDDEGRAAVLEQQVTAHRDDDGTDEVQCEAFAGHGFSAESTR